MSLKIIQGFNCYWHGVVIGHDILVRGVLGTFWGGDSDPEDNGQTASGYPTMGHPDLVAVSLPIPTCSRTRGSPIPVLPFGLKADGSINPLGTQVMVTTPDGKSITAPLIDVGPALVTNHAIDLTQQAFIDLGGDPRLGIISCDYLILGGADHL